MKQRDDSYWLDARNFIKTHLKPGEQIVAPARFKSELPNAYSYNATYTKGVDQFRWVLIHKGKLTKVNRIFLKRTVERFKPVFANEVFVVFTSRLELVPVDPASPHIQAVLEKKPAIKKHSKTTLKNLFGRVFKETKEVEDLDTDTDTDIARSLDELFRQSDLVLRRLDRLEGNVKKLKQTVQSQASFLYSPKAIAEMSLEELRNACRAACQTAYLGGNTVLCRILSNYLLYGDTRDVGIVPHLCLNGYWEGWITLAVARLLQPGWTCIDVGANAGYYTLLMAGGIGASGRLVALEPNYGLAEMLSKTIEVNGFEDRVQLLTKAVSDRDGEQVRLVVPPNHPGNGTITWESEDIGEVFDVETLTIDSLTADWEQVNLIKIDAEGAEEKVWLGMRETVRRNPGIMIVMEFGAARYPDSRAFLEDIQSEGFILRYIDHDTQIKELTIDRCLTEKPDTHWDLFLSRQVELPA